MKWRKRGLIYVPDGRQAWVRIKQPKSDATNPVDLVKSIVYTKKP